MPGMDLLLRLLIAHVLGDFVLQPRKWVQDRAHRHHRSAALYMHGALHGLLALTAIGDLSSWPLVLLIAVSHIGIDVLKSHKDPKSAKWFLIAKVKTSARKSALILIQYASLP